MGARVRDSGSRVCLSLFLNPLPKVLAIKDYKELGKATNNLYGLKIFMKMSV